MPIASVLFRYALLNVLFLLIPASGALAQTEEEASFPEAAPEDVESVDAIITALYDVISGPIGQQRDWDRFRSIMMPSARLTPVFTNQDGVATHLTWTVEEYVERVDSFFVANGFFEIETARKTERYGNLVHAFSTYESRRKAEDENPFARGINSIQLLFVDGRWWVANIAWQPEQPNLPIPTEYLPADQ